MRRITESNMQRKCRNCDRAAIFAQVHKHKSTEICSQCSGFQWMGKVPPPTELYDKSYFNGSEYIAYEQSAPIYRLNLQRKLQLVRKHIAAPQMGCERILELGSATGEFVQLAIQAGFTDVMGAEVSDFCRAKMLQKQLHVIDPMSPAFMQEVANFKPTVLCGWDVWEHLEKPAASIKKILLDNPTIHCIALTTVDSGAFVPRMKKTKWRQYHPPTHLNYPTRQTFKLFLEDCGFSLKHLKSFGYYRPFTDYLSVLTGRDRLPRWPLLFRIPVYLNLFDIQLVIATKLTR